MPAPANPASPLTAPAIINAFTSHGLELPAPTVFDTIASTNDEALVQASAGAPEWTVVVADRQSAGRGRLSRSWETPAGRGLLFSVILRPNPAWPAASLGWIPLIAGLATSRACGAHDFACRLKWPNDVVIDAAAYDGSPGPRKLAGILAERRGDAVVVGVGINVAHAQAELPIPAATSLALEGSGCDRAQLLAQCLQVWGELWNRFRLGGGDADSSGIRSEYLAESLTIGRRVRVDLGGGAPLVGEAVDIDHEGRLVVDGPFGLRTVSAGDVTHLRH